MAADSVSVQAVYGPAGPVLSGFTELREGTAATTNAETLPNPKTTALLHKQGPCCVCERAPDTQPLMERIRLGLHNFDTLFQAAQYSRLSVRSQRTARNQDLLSDVPPGPDKDCTQDMDQYLFANTCSFKGSCFQIFYSYCRDTVFYTQVICPVIKL